MPYRIEASCVGCRVCAPRCPTHAITGEAKRLHLIDPRLCIDCGVCASYCPVDDCILDPLGRAAPKVKPAGRPRAVVAPDLCTGCSDCVDVCNPGCLELAPVHGALPPVARMTDPKACVACRECELVCSDKRAILLRWPDGSYCESLGQVPPQCVAPRKAGQTAEVRP